MYRGGNVEWQYILRNYTGMVRIYVKYIAFIAWPKFVEFNVTEGYYTSCNNRLYDLWIQYFVAFVMKLEGGTHRSVCSIPVARQCVYEKKINSVRRGKRWKKWKCLRTRTPHNTILDGVFLLYTLNYMYVSSVRSRLELIGGCPPTQYTISSFVVAIIIIIINIFFI